MRRNNHSKRSYELKRLKPVHNEILKRVLVGKRAKDIAKELGVSTATVSRVRNCRLGQEVLKKLRIKRDLRAIRISIAVEEAYPKALENLENHPLPDSSGKNHEDG